VTALEPTDQGDDDESVHSCGRDGERRSHVCRISQGGSATLQAFGGKFVVRGGNLKLLEGQWPHARFVVIEFPSREAAEGWYGSPDYQKIIGLRQNSSVGNLIIAEGGVD